MGIFWCSQRTDVNYPKIKLFYITPDLFNEGSLTSNAAFLKEYFCGVPVLSGWVYAFCGSMCRNSGRLVLKMPNLEIIY